MASAFYSIEIAEHYLLIFERLSFTRVSPKQHNNLIFDWSQYTRAEQKQINQQLICPFTIKWHHTPRSLSWTIRSTNNNAHKTNRKNHYIATEVNWNAQHHYRLWTRRTFLIQCVAALMLHNKTPSNESLLHAICNPNTQQRYWLCREGVIAACTTCSEIILTIWSWNTFI